MAPREDKKSPTPQVRQGHTNLPGGAMTDVNSPFPDLSAGERALVQERVAAFERDWSDSRLAAAIQELPPAGQPLRAVLLVELVKVDLTKQWQRGLQVGV